MPAATMFASPISLTNSRPSRGSTSFCHACSLVILPIGGVISSTKLLHTSKTLKSVTVEIVTVEK
jgi:hypothetical protein